MYVFKQKTAYENEYGLVGSDICIRDRKEGEPCDLVTLTIESPGRVDFLDWMVRLELLVRGANCGSPRYQIWTVAVATTAHRSFK